jgi:hypothetical protein
MLCKQGVTGSIPVTSTNCFFDCKTLVEMMDVPSTLLRVFREREHTLRPMRAGPANTRGIRPAAQ